MSRTWKRLIHNRDMKHSYSGSLFLCSEWSAREKKKHQRIFLVFMSYIWISECPVTRMMTLTHSFTLFFPNTQSFFHAVFHVFFFTHSWMSTHPSFQSTQTLLHVLVSTHSWMSGCPVTHTNKWLLPMSHNSSHTYEGVKACLDVTHMRRECFSSLWMSHVTHVNAWVPCHLYEWMSASHVTKFVPHIWMGKRMSSCHTYECVGASLRCEWVMSHVWIKKHQRMCFRYVPAKQCGMTPMPPCVDTQCIVMFFSRFSPFHFVEILFLHLLPLIFPRPKQCKTPRNYSSYTMKCRATYLCDDPQICQENVFFGVKRVRIQNKIRTWKRGSKSPMESPKPQYSARIFRREFRTSGGAR